MTLSSSIMLQGEQKGYIFLINIYLKVVEDFIKAFTGQITEPE